MKRLGDECRENGKTKLFQHVKNLLSGDAREEGYRELATGLDMSEGAFRVAVHRLRQRYGILLREEIAQTVAIRVGGIRRATVPPSLAYGATGNSDGTIRPNAALVFEILLSNVQ